MKNFNQKDDSIKATINLDVIPADVSYEEYRALEKENTVLKDAIVKLTIKVISLEKALEVKDE